MNLIDEVTVFVRAGDGGDGSSSFHRTKFRPKGAPDGGDGGSGGDVILRAANNRTTLVDFKRKPHWEAKSGTQGSGNSKNGATADPLILEVPIGTLVWDNTTDDLLADLAVDGAEHVVAKGGRGGRGNSSLSSKAERAPDFAEQGEPGEETVLRLEMRIVADVGLVGSPNAGKSTLLSAVSAATPKIADYPFTTLQPNLGVVERDTGRFILADLPGLIEGAAQGKGLGIRFLRHAHRCAVIAGVVDLGTADITADLDMLRAELTAHDPELAAKLTVVIGTKTDLEPAADAVDEAARWAARHAANFHAVSSVSGDGIGTLLDTLAVNVEQVRATTSAKTFALFRPVSHDPITITRNDDASWNVESTRVERLASQTTFTNPRAVRHMQRRFAAWGVNKALEEAGVEPGDEVHIGSISFEWQP